MADRIKVSTEVLKKWAQDLKAIQTDFNESASILRDLNAIKGSGGELKISADEMLKNGTHIFGTCAEEVVRSLKRALENTGREAAEISRKLILTAELFEETEASNLNLIGDIVQSNCMKEGAEIAFLADAQDRTTKTFDDDKSNGTYGGDQGNMAYNKKGMWFFGFRWFEDEDLYAFIRQHSRYQNYSQTQIAKLLDQINSEGCGYVAMVNNIFVEFEGKEDEFERIFGFPMYDKKGKANYDYLIVDFYANTDNKYYLDEPMGAVALTNDVILEYLGGREDEFRSKYGCDPLIDGRMINPEAQQKILDAYQNSSVATKDVSGTTNYSLENRFRHYLDEKGVSYSTEIVPGGNGMSTTKIDAYLDSGKNVNISVGDFNLYDESGKAVAKDVGNHWMTVTGTTADGRYIVSSWGNRYYLNPSKLEGEDYYITDITP